MIKTSGCHGRLLKTSLLLVSLAVMMNLLLLPKPGSGSRINDFSRHDGSVSSEIKSNCGKIKCIFMVLVSFTSIWPSVVVGGIWFMRSSSEQERCFWLQELASGDLGESGHGGLSL